ncbi:MAG: type II secretion system F family protein [Desulfobacterales bacterium]|nr:type II secretion system F family protein [Desulfobacterales bacterium]
MEYFFYRAYDNAGTLQEGKIPAISIDSAKFKIKELGFIPVKIDKINRKQEKLTEVFIFKKKPSLSDIELFFSKISILLKNGIKIDKALELSKKNIENKRLKKVVSEISDEVRKGTVLSIALEKHLDIFDPLYVSIVRIGEATGHLAGSFSEIANNLVFRRKINAKTKQAMIYPSIIFLVCVLSVLFILNFIVPKLSTLFEGMDSIPGYTQLLLSSSSFFRQYQIFIFMGIIFFVFLIIKFKEKKWFKKALDAVSLKIPIVNNLVIILENLHYSSSLAILLRRGVLLSDALDFAANSVGNIFFKKRLVNVKNEVRQGKKLSDAINKTNFIVSTFDGLIEVGEQSGKLAEIFGEMEDRLRLDYENAVLRLVTILEPLMIIIMGLIVGSIVVLMLLSMVSINDINF